MVLKACVSLLAFVVVPVALGICARAGKGVTQACLECIPDSICECYDPNAQGGGVCGVVVRCLSVPVLFDAFTGHQYYVVNVNCRLVRMCQPQFGGITCSVASPCVPWGDEIPTYQADVTLLSEMECWTAIDH